jgi:2-oxoglutarate ferredoxin oxidoreductase subunit delta
MVSSVVARARTKGSKSGTRVVFYNQWCKKCGICTAVCPRSALAQDEGRYPFLADEEACTSCGLCEVLCPDFAITVPERHEE